VSSALEDADLKLAIAYSYPESFGMLDLSPSSYDTFNTKLLNTESTAVDFSTKTMMKHTDTKTTCDEKCRRKYYCELNYSVNEEVLLCRGYYVDFEYGCHYMVGLFQNPWYVS